MTISKEDDGSDGTISSSVTCIFSNFGTTKIDVPGEVTALLPQ